MMRINHVYLKLIVTVKHEDNGIDWVTYYARNLILEK